MKVDLESTLSFVRAVAAEQGKVLIDRWSSVTPVTGGDQRDFTTEIDVEVEKNIRCLLKERFPGHGFSGEETGDENLGADYCWLVDPIDGTKYYAAQASLFSISIALLYQGEPILGVVQDVTAGRSFYASSRMGAFLDGRALEGPTVDMLSKAIVNVDTPETDRFSLDERAWFEDKLVQLTRQVYRIRALGLGSLSACWLASGALDAYIDLTGYVRPQDLTAGMIIMKEAGLRLETIAPPYGPPRLLAAPEKLWDSLSAILGA
jgi:fructose-1,6-bisphosphatase/inositol monophosphatase family enzyme